MALSDILRITQQIDEEKQKASAASSTSGSTGTASSSTSSSAAQDKQEEEEEFSRPQLTDIKPVETPVEEPKAEEPKAAPKPSFVPKPAKKGAVQRPHQSLYQSDSPMDKLRKEKWYDGDAPTEVDIAARIYKIGQYDDKYAEKLFNDYMGFKEAGQFKETYDSATSTWLSTLGIEDASQITDDVANQFRQYVQEYGVTTASGSLSSSKKNGKEAVLAYNLNELLKDYDATKGLLAEQDEVAKEVAYWIAQGLTDDEIKKKSDFANNGKYKGLNAAMVRTQNGEYTPTTSAIPLLTSYGMDGLLYALRNPDSSKGDLFLDAVQGKLGRGAKNPSTPQDIARRTPGDPAWAPYATSGTMHDEAILFGVTGFDRKWLDDNYARIANSGDQELINAYGRVAEGVERTEKAQQEAAALRKTVDSMIASGMSADRIFTDDLLEEYPTLKAMYEGQQKLKLVDTTSPVGFDLYALRNEAEKAHKDVEGTVPGKDYAQRLETNLGASTPSYEGDAELDKAEEENLTLVQEIMYFTSTPHEQDAAKSSKPNYYRVMASAASGVSAGTGGTKEAYNSAITAANDYAGAHYLTAVGALAEAQQHFNDLKDAAKPMDDFLEKWFPEQDKGKVAEGLVSGDIATPDDPEFQKEFGEMKLHLGFYQAYLTNLTEAEGAVANEQRIIDNIAAQYEAAEELNTTGAPSQSAMPMLNYISQYTNYNAKQEYASFGDWQYDVEIHDVPWNEANELLGKRKENNQKDLEYLDTAIEYAENHHADEQTLTNMRRTRDVIEADNRSIEYAQLQNADGFEAAVEQFDKEQGITRSLFSNDNVVRNAIIEFTQMAAEGIPDDAYPQASSIAGEELAIKIAAMTENERDTYKYLYATEGEAAASEYFTFIDDYYLTNRAMSYRHMVADEMTKEHPILMNAVSIAGSPMQALGLVEVVKSVLTGGEIDPNSEWFTVSHVVGEVRDTSNEMIVEHFGEGTTAAKVATFGYQTIMSVGDSLAAAPLGGAVTMGLESFANTAMEATLNGGDKWDVILLAGITGLAEVGTEYIPMKGLEDAFKAGGKAGLKNHLVDLMKSAASGLTEAPGEALSELISQAADMAIMEELSAYGQNVAQYGEKKAAEIFWKNVGMAGLQGFASGGFQNTVAYVAGSALQGKPQQARPVMEQETAAPVVEEAPAPTEETAVAQEEAPEPGGGLLAEAMAEQNAAPEITPEPEKAKNTRMVAALATAQQDGISLSDRTATVNGVLEAGGLEPGLALAYAKEIAKDIPGLQQLQQSIQKMTTGDTATALKAAAYRMFAPPANADTMSDADVVAAVESDPKMSGAVENAVLNSDIATETMNVLKAMDKKAVENATTSQQNAKRAMNSAATEMGTKNAAAGAAFRALQSANEALKQNPADPKAANKAVEAAKQHQLKKAEAEEARRRYEASKQTFLDANKALQKEKQKASNEARRIAKETVMQRRAEQMLARQQERQQRDIAREQQRQNANADTLDVDDFISNDLTQAGWEPTEEERKKVARLMQERRNARAASRAQSTEAISEPDSNHRFVRAVEKKFGVKVTVTDTSKGGTVLRYNGAYDPRTDSIVIDSNATQSDLIYGTLLHELTHKAERSETYQEFASAILSLKYGGDDTRLAADIRAKQESYNRGLKAMAQLDDSVDATELTADDASREIVADLTREILYGDEASINQLVAEQPSVARRVLDTIKNFIQKLTGVRDPAIDQLNRARELFEKALGEPTQQIKPNEKRNFPTDNIQYSLREEAPPKKTIKGYKVFAVFPNKPGELYPPMVANPGGADTPVGVWLNADAAPSAGETKTGRPQVQAGGKGTNTGKQKLAYRPGWHLGDSPRATQFNRLNPETGKKELFPENFVWAECDVAADLDYQEEAMSYGYNAKGNFQHSLAGLPRLPREEDGTAGFYRYRTNPNPDTVPWIISGAIKVNRILDDNETRAILNEQKQEFMSSEEYASLSDADKEKALERFDYIERKGGDIDLQKYGLTAGDVSPEQRVQYSLDGNGHLLNETEYARLRSNWNSQETGVQFESRKNGGKIIAMDNLLVYTDQNGEPEQVVEINQDDLWLQNDIQQSLIQMEMDGVDVETQRIVLEGLVGTGSAYFRDRGSMQEPSGQERAGAGRNARAVRKGNYVEVSYEDEKVNGGRTQYSLPSDMVLVEMIDRYLARQEQGGGIAPPNMTVGQPGQQEQPRMGKRQFANQTLQDSPAMPDWLKQEMRSNPAESDYEIDSNYAQAERGWNRIQENGYEQERDRLLQLERFSADDTAEANLIMAMAEREGDAETLLAVASKYNREGTKVGHELQARKLFTRMSPTAAKVMVAGQLESRLQDELRERRPLQRRMDEHAQRVADRLTALPEPEEASSENRWHVPLNQQQLELIREYGLQRTRRPGIYYNRATTEQRMLEAIIATPNPLAATGNGLNLVQRLEYMNNGLAVVTNADLNYIGTQLGQFIGLGGEVGGRDADVAVARAYEAFGNITPVGIRQKMRTWRYMSMLGTLTSPARNIIGNVAQSVPNAVSHGLAANVVDPIVSLFTGHRTTASLDVRERVEGWRAFVQETRDTFNDFFVDRVEVQNRQDDKFNTNRSGRVYQSPVLEAARNLEGFLMSVGDRNFWRKAYVNSIAEQQKLLDRGLLRNEDGTTPTQEQILERAEAEANYATFNEDNRVRDALTALKQVPGLGDAIDLIMPFTGVPTNIISRMWQYSPMGLASTVLTHAYRGMSGQNFDQRAFVNGFSRGITGTALFGVGMILQAAGIIRLGTGDEEDDKKRGVRTAQGEQYTPYIYNPFNDEYVGLAAFAPAISPLIMGATAQDILKDEGDKWVAVQNAAFAGLDQIFDASYMTGLADVFGGYGSPSENIGTSLFSSAVSQNVPALLGQLADAMDPYVRDTKDKNLIMESLKSGLINNIPGLRESLPKKIDVTGQPVMQGKEGIENFFNPFTVTDARNDAVLNEMMRVGALPYDALSGRRNDLTSNGVDFTVDAKGKETYKQRYGDLWYNGGTYVDGNGNRLEVPGVADLIDSSVYAKMTDTEKKKAINKILELAARVAKAEAAVAAGEDPAKVWGKAEESQRSVLKSNAQIQVEAGHYSALTTYVSDLRKTGVANKYIKGQITTLMKPIYKELNRKGETEKMKEIRRILYQTGMYDDFNFEKEWLK